jgi:ubiquinone/menaquinone biosynthesis C-methylase UbiE
MCDRTSFLYKLKRGLSNPSRIIPYYRHSFRNRKLAAESRDFIQYYARVVDYNAAYVSPDLAVGSSSREHWMEIGKFQFDYLVGHGLKPHHRFLDVGCGNLRLGSMLIAYLNPNCYVGVDISPRIVCAALRTIEECNLQRQCPYIYLLGETSYQFLPESHFDHVHAHSVFTHLPLSEIEKVLRETRRVMKPGACFDFTYNPSNKIGNFLREDFYYPTETMMQLAKCRGFEPAHMQDWHYSQDKIRAVKPQISN